MNHRIFVLTMICFIFMASQSSAQLLARGGAERFPGGSSQSRQDSNNLPVRKQLNTQSSGQIRSQMKGQSQNHQISDPQKQNIETLKADFSKIKSESNVSAEQKQKLKNDLSTIGQNATRPDPKTIDHLSSDFKDATADGSISKVEKAKLIHDTQAVLESANISPKDVQTAIKDVNEILDASNVDQADVDMIIKDLQAIGRETR